MVYSSRNSLKGKMGEIIIKYILVMLMFVTIPVVLIGVAKFTIYDFSWWYVFIPYYAFILYVIAVAGSMALLSSIKTK